MYSYQWEFSVTVIKLTEFFWLTIVSLEESSVFSFLYIKKIQSLINSYHIQIKVIFQKDVKRRKQF